MFVGMANTLCHPLRLWHYMANIRMTNMPLPFIHLYIYLAAHTFECLRLRLWMIHIHVFSLCIFWENMIVKNVRETIYEKRDIIQSNTLLFHWINCCGAIWFFCFVCIDAVYCTRYSPNSTIYCIHTTFEAFVVYLFRVCSLRFSVCSHHRTRHLLHSTIFIQHLCPAI